MKEFIPCDRCEKGFIFNDEERTSVKCSCLKIYQRNKKLSHLLKNANIPLQISSNKDSVDLLSYNIDKDYIGKDEVGNIPKIKKFIENFDEKYSSLNLYFYGKHSTQKSTIARYTAKELILKGKSVYYILTDSLVRMLVDSDREEELRKELKKILKVDCLILEEFSGDKTTIYKSGFQIPYLTAFLKKRLEIERKSTIFCSNSPIDNIGSCFEEAIQRLVKREVLDPMEFKDDYEKLKTNFDVSSLWD